MKKKPEQGILHFYFVLGSRDDTAGLLFTCLLQHISSSLSRRWVVLSCENPLHRHLLSVSSLLNDRRTRADCPFGLLSFFFSKPSYLKARAPGVVDVGGSRSSFIVAQLMT